MPKLLVVTIIMQIIRSHRRDHLSILDPRNFACAQDSDSYWNAKADYAM